MAGFPFLSIDGANIPGHALVAWWKADGDFADSAGSNHLTPFGVTFGAGVSGQGFVVGNCAAPPCSTGYLTAPPSDAWNFKSKDFSIVLWANFARESTGGEQTFLSHDDNRDTKWIFSYGAGRLSFHTKNGPGSAGEYPILTPFSPPVGEWTCVALTRNSQTHTLSVWANGQVLTQNTNYDAEIPSTTVPLSIAEAEDWGQFQGVLDCIYIFNQALEADAIREIYLHPGTDPASLCVPHAAKAKLNVVNGFVVGAEIIDAGCGYTNAPSVVISGDGAGAVATTTISDGAVSSIKIVNAGAGYTASTIMRIASPPFVPWLQLSVSKVKVTQHIVLGKNYLLETTTDFSKWTTVGQSFTAQDEILTQEFDVDVVGRYFRISQVP